MGIQSTKRYLLNVSKRVQYYHDVRRQAIRYIVKHKILDSELGCQLILISAAWATAAADDVLTQDELVMFFDIQNEVEEEDNVILPPNESIKLHEDFKDLALDTVLDATVDAFYNNE